MKIALSTIVFLFAVTAHGKCELEVNPINEGDPAQCTGFLITPMMESWFNHLYEDNQLYKLQLDNRNKTIEALQQKADYQDINMKLCQDEYNDLQKSSSKQSFKDKLTYFAVGALSIVIFNSIQKH